MCYFAGIYDKKTFELVCVNKVLSIDFQFRHLSRFYKPLITQIKT